MPVFELIPELQISRLVKSCAICRCTEEAYGKLFNGKHPEGVYLCKTCTVNHPDFRPTAPLNAKPLRLASIARKRTRSTGEKQAIMSQIINLFVMDCQPKTLAFITQSLDFDQIRVKQAVFRLKDEGVLNRLERGVYAYTHKSRPTYRKRLTSSKKPETYKMLRDYVLRYLNGRVGTLKDVVAGIKEEFDLDYSRKAVRSMLIRLHDEGVLSRHRDKGNQPFIYRSLTDYGDVSG